MMAMSSPSRRSSDCRYARMSPSGGLITTVEPCITWSPVNSIRLFEQVAHMVRGVARRVDRAQRASPQLDALAVLHHEVRLEGASCPAGAGRPSTMAPVAALSRAAAGE